jgi:hypothetical protein
MVESILAKQSTVNGMGMASVFLRMVQGTKESGKIEKKMVTECVTIQTVQSMSDSFEPAINMVSGHTFMQIEVCIKETSSRIMNMVRVFAYGQMEINSLAPGKMGNGMVFVSGSFQMV